MHKNALLSFAVLSAQLVEQGINTARVKSLIPTTVTSAKILCPHGIVLFLDSCTRCNYFEALINSTLYAYYLSGIHFNGHSHVTTVHYTRTLWRRRLEGYYDKSPIIRTPSRFVNRTAAIDYFTLPFIPVIDQSNRIGKKKKRTNLSP